MTFRQQLTPALLTLLALRLFLPDKCDKLPNADDGYRGVRPDMETFCDFAWPAYLAVPGTVKAGRKLLLEPDFVQAESELRAYWQGYWQKGAVAVGSYRGLESIAARMAWLHRRRRH